MYADQVQKEVDDIITDQERENLKAILLMAGQRVNALYKRQRKSTEMIESIQKTRDELLAAHNAGKLLEVERLPSRLSSLAAMEL